MVGHPNRMKNIRTIVNEYYPNIQLYSIEYTDMSKTIEYIDIIKNKQLTMDAVLFTGSLPYKIINSIMLPSIPFDFIRTNTSSLLNALMTISLSNKYDINKLSFDTYNIDDIKHIYSEFDSFENHPNLYVAEENALSSDYCKNVFDFHKTHYEKAHISCCLTALNNVYEALKKNGIPCIVIDPTTEILKNTIERIHLKHMATIGDQFKIVVIIINIELPNEYSITNVNEYEQILENMKVLKQIYIFGQRLQAAVVQLNPDNYLLFTTKKAIETETNQYKNIELLKKTRGELTNSVNIGIGYGFTARDAKYSAKLGIEKAKACKGNIAYVLDSGKTIIGPIKWSEKNKFDSNNNHIDAFYYQISEDTGLSIDTIYKLHSLVNLYQKDTYTSTEMATALKITPRSMNKILKKLENKNFIKIIGKTASCSVGRPKRIIKILF